MTSKLNFVCRTTLASVTPVQLLAADRLQLYRMPNISFVGAKKRKTRHSGYVFRMTRQEPGSTQLALASSGLLSLVDELLLNIIDHIDSKEALCYFALTCTRFQGLVEPYIWRDLLVLTGGHARRIMQALDSREERVEYIQSLSIRYKEGVKEGIEELNHFIALMSRLKHFTLESPCPNNDEWRSGLFFDGYSRIDYTNLLASAVYPRIGHPLALPMLQSRKHEAQLSIPDVLTCSSYTAWSWCGRPEVPPWPS
jgi:hypothetical protein